MESELTWDVSSLVLAMQGLPSELRDLADRVRRLRETFQGVDVELEEYVAQIEAQLAELEHLTATSATKALLIGHLAREMQVDNGE